MASSNDFLFRGDIAEFDSAVAELIERERDRQYRKLILIPSESVSPAVVHQALGSVFMHIYAEGYPHPDLLNATEEEVLDFDARLAHFRRYGDRRYYRGVEYADLIEALAGRRCARAFATDSVSADDIHVNVQPLSGAPANLAVMQALLEPGDTIMGLELAHGGHLTHGSPVNMSGKLYNVVSYGVDQETERLNYNQIEQLALEHKPKLIIAGYTSYPWAPDWARFRQIADRVGAVLMADIAHVAGLVVAGAYPTPIEHAHVITFTTHKTLCGPRGACILSTDRGTARKIKRAVFPGMQGGPHVNKFAALALAFKLAQTEQFHTLQHQIVANAKALADGLREEGLRLPCGGTDTHLLLVDCKTVQAEDGTPLMGDTAATVLDLIGIVVNKNSIPGDTRAFYPSGIRLGTPWVTQRGLREREMRQIARIIAQTLKGLKPFTYTGVRRTAYRGKIDFDLMRELRREVTDLAKSAGIDYEPPEDVQTSHFKLPALDTDTAYQTLRIRGEYADAFVDPITPANVLGLSPEEWTPATLLEPSGELMSRVLLQKTKSDDYHMVVPTENTERTIAWLQALSDGYVEFDTTDILAKVPGPVVVEHLGAADPASLPEAEGIEDTAPPRGLVTKPYFIGLSGPEYKESEGEGLPRFIWEEKEDEELLRTPLFDWHVEHGANMAPFAGWEMPLWYTSIHDEHLAVRESAGLFDVGHMGLLEITGPDADLFLNLVTSNDVHSMGVGDSQYAYLLDPSGHVIDDVMSYRVGESRYLMVVNAANEKKDWAWLNGVKAGQVQIDRERPWVKNQAQVTLNNLHTPEKGTVGWCDLALQGPRSLDILLTLLNEAPAGQIAEIQEQLKELRRTKVMEATIPHKSAPNGSYHLFIARTGYTGEKMSFELLVEAEGALSLWEQLMRVGAPLGLQPVGLGARDSLRIEAGLPLYGHELSGPLNLRPHDAGFAGYVKFHKAFFIGREATKAYTEKQDRIIVRFVIDERGVRLPKQGYVVTDNRGRIIGQVTSCAMGTEGELVGMAYVSQRRSEEGTDLRIYPEPSREDWTKPYDQLELGDRMIVPNRAVVVSRFP